MSIEIDRASHLSFDNDEELSQYIFEETIGQGNFGKVKLATYIPTKEKVAVKILNKEQIQIKNEMHLVQRELNIIKQFNHVNVIYVHQIIEDEENYYIIMDYCDKGELFDYIVHQKRLSEEETSVLFYQLINGVEYIHSKHIVHRDLKPENLLITKNKTLKIIDFGLSSYFNEDTVLTTKCGSPSYAAPEIITGTQYNGFKTDVWCCGIILYAMICGYLPFDGDDNKELFKNIIESTIEFPEYISTLVQEMISKMLEPDPNKRLTVNQIKEGTLYLKGKELLCNRISYRKQRPKSLHLLSNNVDMKSFKNKIISIQTKVNSLTVKPISSKIEQILKTDPTLLYQNLKHSKANLNLYGTLVIPKGLKNLFLQKYNQKFPLKQILERRLKSKEINNMPFKSKHNSKKPQIIVESNIHPILPKNKRMNSQATLQRGLSTKMNTRCLPTEPKEFQECLRNDFKKYIKDNSKPQKNINYLTTTTQSKTKMSKSIRSKSNEDKFFLTKNKHNLPQIVQYY